LDAVSRELGLWGLDAPEDVGGSNLPMAAMVGVEEELARTAAPYTLLPDSPNLKMLMATVDVRQRAAYLAPYVAGETLSALAISEPLSRWRPGRHEDLRRARWRGLGDQRSEDLDQPRAGS
jgi:acyl-CoA dehydrogenase